MYNSLKRFLKTPLVIKPVGTRDRAGDRVAGIPINTLCYPEYRVNTVVSPLGAETISEITLYVDGTHEFNSDALMEYDGKEYAIKSLSAVFDKNIRDMWVVYI